MSGEKKNKTSFFRKIVRFKWRTNIKDGTERDLGESFYKYSGIDLGWSCNECMNCIHSEAHRENRLFDKLQGEVFFSSPLKFNDIIDSQLDVVNNSNELDDDKLLLKLNELFYKENEEIGYINDLKNKLKESDYETVKKAREKQLENIGILCFTTDNTNATMWGYYTDNQGICIEYNTNNLIFDIVTGFASKMNSNLINVLKDKNYLKENRDIRTRKKRTEFAKEIFNDEKEIVKALKKNKTLSLLTSKEQKYFIQNLYVKRLWGKKVKYCKKSALDNVKPNLFENKKTRKISGKYFAKEKFWEHEQEYRFILSLGGGAAVKLRKGTIKSITFGANTSKETINYCRKYIDNDVVINKIVVKNNRLKAEPY